MKTIQKIRLGMASLALLCVGHVNAQSLAREAREESLQASRYEQIIGKLQQQNEDLLGQLRALQRNQTTMQRAMDTLQTKMQGVADDAQKLGAVDLRNVNAAQRQLAEKVNSLSQKPVATPWGDGQRDCTDLAVKHQQIKVVMKPDGTRSMKFLCFDGKALNMGSEMYVPQDEAPARKGVPIGE